MNDEMPQLDTLNSLSCHINIASTFTFLHRKYVSNILYMMYSLFLSQHFLVTINSYNMYERFNLLYVNYRIWASFKYYRDTSDMWLVPVSTNEYHHLVHRL